MKGQHNNNKKRTIKWIIIGIVFICFGILLYYTYPMIKEEFRKVKNQIATDPPVTTRRPEDNPDDSANEELDILAEYEKEREASIIMNGQSAVEDFKEWDSRIDYMNADRSHIREYEKLKFELIDIYIADSLETINLMEGLNVTEKDFYEPAQGELLPDSPFMLSEEGYISLKPESAYGVVRWRITNISENTIYNQSTFDTVRPMLVNFEKHATLWSMQVYSSYDDGDEYPTLINELKPGETVEIFNIFFVENYRKYEKTYEEKYVWAGCINDGYFCEETIEQYDPLNDKRLIYAQDLFHDENGGDQR